MATKTEEEHKRFLTWCATALAGLVLMGIAWWANHINSTTSNTNDRVTRLEKDVVEVKTDVKNIKEANQRMENKLDGLEKLLIDRLPKKPPADD